MQSCLHDYLHAERNSNERFVCGDCGKRLRYQAIEGIGYVLVEWEGKVN